MLSLYEASDLLRRATFKIRIENNTLGYLGGTGFFISKDGYALTAYHNLPKSVLQTGKGTLEINYKNQWLTVDCLLHISSKESDIAVLKLTEVKDVSIEFVKIGYVNPSLSFRERTQFWGGRPVCAFGFPFVGKGQADRLVDGTIDGGQPLTTLPEPTENSFGEEIEV